MSVNIGVSTIFAFFLDFLHFDSFGILKTTHEL